MTLPSYEIVRAAHWAGPDGRTASIYGALPYTTDAERALWRVVETGWTVRDNRTGTVGIGRAPFATREEAEAWVARRNVQMRATEYPEALDNARLIAAAPALYEALLSAANALDRIREADQSPGHITYLTKTRMAEIAAAHLPQILSALVAARGEVGQ